MNALVTLLLLSLASVAIGSQHEYLVGIGKGDITGPAADVNLMGYAVINQTAKGIHTRLYARAFMFAEAARPERRFLFVSIDAAMAAQMLTMRVIERLQAEFGSVYNHSNVVITATHTHASPGGFLEHMLYHVTSLGFVRQSFDAMLEGILDACHAAHASLQPAVLTWAEGEVHDANINRSPTAYMNNPQSERAQNKYDVEKDMTVLKIETPATADQPARGKGLLSWFPVHPTSMSNTNTLISGDNKGAAEQFVEKHWAPKQQQLEPNFTAAFIQSNGADTSPNVLGTFCLDTGLPCDVSTSTCNGNNHLCIGRGPAYPDDVKSTQIIGQRQADGAQAIWSGPSQPVTGPIDYRHIYIDITAMTMASSNFTHAGRTCPGAMGYSFAAGTTDGPGAPGFYQSDNHTGLAPASALVRIVNSALHSKPDSEQIQCQGDKPILLNIGQALKPYPWVPKVTEVAILRLGNFVIMCLPGEFTTMAGRRLRSAVYQTLRPAWGDSIKIVLSTICNTYSSYVTTFEEYAVQRYEGASTLYGPHTLDAYIQTAVGLAQALVNKSEVVSAATPENFESKLLSLLPPVIMDTVPFGKRFGEVLEQPNSSVYMPGHRVEVAFWSANPRNNLRRNGTFLEVQLYNASTGSWSTVHTDDDWCTKYRWDRPKGSLSESTATIQWDIPYDVVPGRYRIQHFGDWKALSGKVTPFEGVSAEFRVAHNSGLEASMRMHSER